MWIKKNRNEQRQNKLGCFIYLYNSLCTILNNAGTWGIYNIHFPNRRITYLSGGILKRRVLIESFVVHGPITHTHTHKLGKYILHVDNTQTGKTLVC